MINHFIRDVCELLGILPPEISFDTSTFPTSSTLAQARKDGKLIKVRKKNNPDMYFAVAHELRHIWQIRNGWDFSEYKQSDTISDEEYNLQPAELDAQAFAKIVMVEFFHITPLFKGLPKSVVAQINKRANEIARELKEKPH